MRIISGEFGGRSIDIPRNKWPTRPTTDRVREALFNILIHNYDIENVKVLDLFAGTGMNSWEFLSRGAKYVTLVDRHKKICAFLESIADKLNVTGRVGIVCRDVLRYLQQSDDTYEIIFADPPYDYSSIINLFDLILEYRLLDDEGVFILEHSSLRQFSHESFDIEQRVYGDSTLSFCSLKK